MNPDSIKVEERPDICLVVPPFDAINFLALGSSVLASACRARGLRFELIYGSVLLAAQIGYEVYKAVRDKPMSALLGEHLFRPHAYPEDREQSARRSVRVPRELQELHDKLVPKIGPFQDDLARRIIARNPRILGISSTFQQNLAGAGLEGCQNGARCRVATEGPAIDEFDGSSFLGDITCLPIRRAIVDRRTFRKSRC